MVDYNNVLRASITISIEVKNDNENFALLSSMENTMQYTLYQVLDIFPVFLFIIAKFI